MKIRELLKYQLWSKATTRKVLAVSRKFLFRVGIVFGILFVVFGTWVAVERFWLTTGERNAAREALVLIDALQNQDSLSDQEFDAKAKLAKEKVEAAKQKVVTGRDGNICDGLDGYLFLTTEERDSVRREKAMVQWCLSLSNPDSKRTPDSIRRQKRLEEMCAPQVNRDMHQNEQSRSTDREARHIFVSMLHRYLD